MGRAERCRNSVTHSCESDSRGRAARWDRSGIGSGQEEREPLDGELRNFVTTPRVGVYCTIGVGRRSA